MRLETREQVHICPVSLRYLYELKAMSKVRIWKLLMYNQRVVGGNVD